MALADLSSVLKVFGGSEPSEAEQQALYKEALLMTLARASSSDANIHRCEIKTIQRIVQRETGEELSEADIRKASRKELYESVNLHKYLRSMKKRLQPGDRVKISQALADVIKSDTQISVLEIDYFNGVAEALGVTPAELVGLHK